MTKFEVNNRVLRAVQQLEALDAVEVCLYIQHQDRLGMDRIGSLSDQALLQIWQKLEPHQPRVIGLDFFHDFPFAPELAAELAASDRFIAVCEISKTVDVDTPVSIPAPPGTPIEQVGFTDFPIDRDYRVRRQLLGMPGSEECQTNQSFSLQVALHYLKPEESSLKWLDEHLVAIGETALPKLRLNAGGYQLPAEEERRLSNSGELSHDASPPDRFKRFP